ncbi:MAG TPA: hypothetical protein VKL21_10575, partial [Candidatus Methanoperedens sp.]|nr:hypothetical protein [Candidatus Methanoperedens sp.]
VVRTPWAEINEELRTECALLDALIQRWTKEQAEAILYQIQRPKFNVFPSIAQEDLEHSKQGLTQVETAKILNISQSAVFQRLKIAGYWAVQVFLEHFKMIIQDKVRESNIRLEPYNHIK